MDILINYIFLVLIFYGGYRLLVKFFKFLSSPSRDNLFNTPIRPFEFAKPKPVEEKPKLPYRKQSRFFNKSEEAFFLELKNKLPHSLYVFPKVRMVDFIKSSEIDRFKRKLGDQKLMPKHVDFLIVDQNYRPLMAIEVNGKSHLSEKRKKSDQFKKDICESVGLPLEIIKVGDSFYESVNRITSSLKSP